MGNIIEIEQTDIAEVVCQCASPEHFQARLSLCPQCKEFEPRQSKTESRQQKRMAMVCQHRGKVVETRMSSNGQRTFYRCSHPDHRVVDGFLCPDCNDFQEAAKLSKDKKLWLDVGTTAIPRLLTAKCMGSFLDKMQDRNDYLLRWIFHLDWMDHAAFEKNWQENIAQATDFSRHFDDALILISTTNQGYGRSIWNVLRHVQHDALWIEDDKLWTKSFRLANVIRSAQDAFYFAGPNVKVGSTNPGFWKWRIVEHLMKKYPSCPRRISEDAMKRLLHGRAGFRANRTATGVPREPFVDAGKQVLTDMGFEKNFFGKLLRKASVRVNRPKIKKRVLVIGWMRGGTKFIAKFLKSLELRVEHESMGPDGAVGWYYTTDVPWPGPKRGEIGYGEGLTRDDFKFDAILHQVRHPLKNIASNVRHSHWVRSYLHRAINQSVGILPSKPIVECMASIWLRWNLLAESVADWTYRVEDIQDGSPVYAELCRRLNVKPPVEFPDIPQNTHNYGECRPITTADLSQKPWLLQQIDEAAQRWGYESLGVN